MTECEVLLGRLPQSLQAQIRTKCANKTIEEIRLRVMCPAEVVADGRSLHLPFSPDSAQMHELAAALCGYALYSCEEKMEQGYIPLPGGHRAGVCGVMVRGTDGRMRMTKITSVCIRIAHHIIGAGRKIYPYLFSQSGQVNSLLMVGPPGCGKTTALRDCALYLSDRSGMHVAVADEREELFIIGEAGRRIDILAGTAKAQAITMLIRTMSPHVIVTDEIGRMEDALSIADAARCGVHVVATAHGQDMADVLKRPALAKLFEMRAFDRYVFLSQRASLLGVYDGDGQALERKEEKDDDEHGGSGDDHDFQLRRRLFAL